jgi:hypothetical protein
VRVLRWLFVALAILGCDDGPTEAELEGHRVTVPAGWETERGGRGPMQELVLHHPSRSVVCRLVVIQDGRSFGETDRAAFVASGRDTYGGRGERPARIDTAEGPLEGSAFVATRVDATWDVRALAGSPELEIVAQGRGTELVAAVVGTYGGDPERATKARACRSAIASLR